MKPELSRQAMGSLPSARRERRDGRDRRVGRREAAHDLDELHDGHGVEEMQAREAVGPLRCGGHLGDRQRRRVRAEDRVRPAERVERLVDLALDAEVLDDGLDDEIGGGEFFREDEVQATPRIASPSSAPACRVRLPSKVKFSMRRLPAARAFSSTSRTTTVNPAFAHTSAIPDPMSPAPRTPDGSKIVAHESALHSTTTAMPWPPPMHADARPQRLPRRRSSLRSVSVRRAPLAPSGCPSAIAPPFTFSFARSTPSSLIDAEDLARERLVDLDEVHVGERLPRLRERRAARGDRTEAHERRDRTP